MKADPLVIGYTAEQIHQFARDIPEQLKSVAGVKQVAVSENGIFSGTDGGTTVKSVEGFVPANESDLDIAFDEVGPGYFETIGSSCAINRPLSLPYRIRLPRRISAWPVPFRKPLTGSGQFVRSRCATQRLRPSVDFSSRVNSGVYRVTPAP